MNKPSLISTAPLAADSDARVNLLGMPRAELERFFVGLGEKPWRAKQLMKWVYHAGVGDFDAMTDISRALRARLTEMACIEPPVLTAFPAAADGTRKWSVAVGDGECVEAVLIPESGRATLCISSQVGCTLDCAFCATGKQGFNGNLSRAEIVGQAWAAARQLAAEGSRRGITNIVFMGMGEPLYNFDAVMDAASVFADDLGFGISRRRVTISTAGVVPRIRELASRSEVSLAVSLHAADDELRSRLVPLNRKYPIAELLDACREWLAQLGDRRTVTIEYTLMEGVNDALSDAVQLAELLRDLRCKVNLIPFNPFPEPSARGSARGRPSREEPAFARPSMRRVRAFQTHLLNAGIPAMLRATRGDDITAACGQLVGQVRDRTRRKERRQARRRVAFEADQARQSGAAP